MDLMDQFKCPRGRQGRIVAALMNRGHKTLTTWGLTHVVIQSNFTILDVGCGGGKTVNRLAEMTPQGKVFGVDYSSDMVEYTRKLNRKLVEQGRVEIVEGSADRTGLPSDTFDLVTACETYYFWPSLPNAFKEILRVLKPDGTFLMINEMIKDGVCDVKRADLIEKTHVRLYGLEEIKGMLQSAGFVEVEVNRKPDSAWNTIAAKKPAV